MNDVNGNVFVITTDHEGSQEGSPLESTVGKAMTLESMWFPFIFTRMKGFYEKIDKAAAGKMRSITNYLNFRVHQLFSVFTLFKMYIPLMWQLRQCTVIANAVRRERGCLARVTWGHDGMAYRWCVYSLQVGEQVLQEAVHNYRKAHPNATDYEVMKHIARHKVPGTVMGSPQWHSARLGDLLAMVKKWGMPHFFLTLAAGDREWNGDQWEEVRRGFGAAHAVATGAWIEVGVCGDARARSQRAWTPF